MKIEKEKLQAAQASITEIEVNEYGDKIYISADDPALFDRYAAGFKEIYDMAESIPVKIDEIEKKYDGQEDFRSVMEKTLAISKENVGFSEKSTEIIDGIFGAGTVKKYFRKVYENIQDFTPDSYCFLDFLEAISPVMESVFGRRIEQREKESRKRMEKYKPQDYKKPAHVS